MGSPAMDAIALKWVALSTQQHFSNKCVQARGTIKGELAGQPAGRNVRQLEATVSARQAAGSLPGGPDCRRRHYLVSVRRSLCDCSQLLKAHIGHSQRNGALQSFAESRMHSFFDMYLHGRETELDLLHSTTTTHPSFSVVNGTIAYEDAQDILGKHQFNDPGQNPKIPGVKKRVHLAEVVLALARAGCMKAPKASTRSFFHDAA